MLNREQKTKIIDYLEKLCETSRISKKTLGNTIRSYHVSCPFVVLILLFFGSQLCVTISAINLIFVFGMFVITNGCLLTMLEHRLCGDEFTIADPFIETLGIELNSKTPKAIFIEEGLAHAFIALEDDTIVTYFVNQYFNPTNEKAINPLDPEISINWGNLKYLISEKDKNAKTLSEMQELGHLPIYKDCLKLIETLKN